jgi:hypothetical protein
MNKTLLDAQQRNLADMDELNAKLRKEYDAARLANKRRNRELQQVTSELSQVERLAQTDRLGAAGSLAAPTHGIDAKIDAINDKCTVSFYRRRTRESRCGMSGVRQSVGC